MHSTYSVDERSLENVRIWVLWCDGRRGN